MNWSVLARAEPVKQGGRDGSEEIAEYAGSHVLDEAERSLHDALCVLSQTVQDARVVYGGGFPEMQMAKASALLSGCLFMALKLSCCAHICITALHSL